MVRKCWAFSSEDCRGYSKAGSNTRLCAHVPNGTSIWHLKRPAHWYRSHHKGLNKVFFCNDGSEAVDTALKMALAYHRARGDAGRFRLIGRERAYHGVGFGGISVGGIAGIANSLGPALSGVDHLRHPLDINRNAFSKGLPEHGAELAQEFEQRLLATHDPSTVAALIIEPVQGSTGVIIIPPRGYLERST